MSMHFFLLKSAQMCIICHKAKLCKFILLMINFSEAAGNAYSLLCIKGTETVKSLENLFLGLKRMTKTKAVQNQEMMKILQTRLILPMRI